MGFLNRSAMVAVACAGVWGLSTASTTWATVNLDTVHVGNAGNTADTQIMIDSTTGYGLVSYEYNIGKYEVTAGQYNEFLNAVAATDTYGLYNTIMSNTQYGSGITRSGSPGSYSYSVDSAYVNRPVNCVSWGDAARFANWMHNGQPNGAQDSSTTEDGSYTLNGANTNAALEAITRNPAGTWFIPTENEWYKAAYYSPTLGGSGGYYDYATASDTLPGRDLADVSGNNANYYGTPTPIEPPYLTTVVGEFQNSDSPYGTFDQSGNVWEWNEAITAPYRGQRGGSFNDDENSLPASLRNSNVPMNESSAVGFRVSLVPEPGFLGMLALIGAPLLLRRWSVQR